jgi:hypothetical protein
MAGYDAWKLENRDDEQARLYRHRHSDEPLPVRGGICACGRETNRSLAGIGWQCSTCREACLRAQYERKARTA